MVRKIQTSIILEPELKHIVDTEGLNLSKFVNEMLSKYFSVSSVEDVDRKIREHRNAISVLEQKRADLLERGVAEDRSQALRDDALAELQELYRKRRDSGVQRDLDRSWLLSPRNLERLRVVGWEVDEAVHRLRSWYDGLQED